MRGLLKQVRGSIRAKYAFWVNLFLVAPMAAYLVLDTRLERRRILDSRLEILASMADLMVDATLLEPGLDIVNIQRMLTRFHHQNPELEILLLDPRSQVLASTHPDRVGLVWQDPSVLEVLGGKAEKAWSFMEHEGVPVLDLTLAIPQERESGMAAIHIAEPQSTLERETRQALIRDTLFVVGLLLLMAWLVNRVTGRLIINRLGAVSRDLQASGWMRQEVGRERHRDELDELAIALKDMVARIDATTRQLRGALGEKERLLDRVAGFNEELTVQVKSTREELEAVQDELLRKQRLSVIGELAAGLAHEIRNPLQIIRGTAETAHRRHPAVAPLLEDIFEEVNRMDTLVRSLLDYARPLAITPEPVALLSLAEGAAGELAHNRGGGRPALDIPPDLRVLGEEYLLHRVLVNLLTNAMEAQGGTLEGVDLEARRVGERVVTRIKDRGAGIAEEDESKLFEPFFSRKEAGIGMGLPLSRRVVEQHHGTLELTRRLGGGAEVVLTLPAHGGGDGQDPGS